MLFLLGEAQSTVQGNIWPHSIKILVFPSPIDYMLWSFGFSLLIRGILCIFLEIIDKFHEVLKFNQLFLKLNQFTCN